jgi:hypothetical protein
LSFILIESGPEVEGGRGLLGAVGAPVSGNIIFSNCVSGDSLPKYNVREGEERVAEEGRRRNPGAGRRGEREREERREWGSRGGYLVRHGSGNE